MLPDVDEAAVRDSIAKCAISLIVREPFYGHLLSGIARHVDPGAPALSLALDRADVPHLSVSPTWWEALGNPARLGALKRQLLHLVFEHPFRVGEFARRRIYDVATELVVNQYLAPGELGPDALTLDALRLPAGRGVDELYRLLLERLDAAQAGTGSGRVAAAEAGGEASEASDGGGEDGEDGEVERGEGAGLRALLRDGHPSFDEHAGWDGFARADAATREVVAACVRTLVRRTADRAPWADLPSAVVRAISQHLHHAEPIDWRRWLRVFSDATRRTRIRNTLRRPSKRYGTTPGIRVQRIGHRLLVALDTSGSIGADELAAFFAELRVLRRRGASIRVVECDAAIAAQWEYRGHTPEHVRGGGGTAFDPVLSYANEIRPDGVVYFTDGWGPRPEVACRVPILWVITPGGVQPDAWGHLPGRKVPMRA